MKTNKYFLLSSIIIFVFSFKISVATAPAINNLLKKTDLDFNKLLKQMQKMHENTNVDAVTISSWLMQQKPDGSWADIIYGKLPYDVKLNNTHLERILNLVKICTNESSASYNSPNYREVIKKGLDYWFVSNTKHWNWWFHYIDYPKKIACIIALMRKLPDNDLDENKMLTLLTPTSIPDICSHGGGANMLDIATHYVYRGILTKDAKLLEQTVKTITDSLVTNLQADLVYLDHGPQLYINGYGTAFIAGVLSIADLLNKTPVAFNAQEGNFVTFLKFVREVWIPSIRGQFWDFSIMGRSVANPNGLKANIAVMVKKFADIDSKYADFYNNACDRITGKKIASYQTPIFNKHYWKADYTQHSRKDYFFSTRSVSTRTVEAESGNGANLKSHYFSLGANCIMVNGDEYYNLMPVWDWAMIPGITYPHTSSFPTTRKDWGTNFGLTNFVGGVSDGLYAVNVYNMQHGTTTAKKSWFMFDKEIVALGANICDNSSMEVYTTINQCTAENYNQAFNRIAGSQKEEKISDSIIKRTPTADYVRHGQIAYYFPYPQNVNLRIGNQYGTVSSIANGSNAILSKPVFSLWIDHGIKAINQSYAYIIVPNITTESEAKSYASKAIKIIANTDSVQVVYHQGLNIYGAAFYYAGGFQYEALSIKSNKACVLLLKPNRVLSIADPTQNLENIEVSITLNGTTTNKTIAFTNKGESVTMAF